MDNRNTNYRKKQAAMARRKKQKREKTLIRIGTVVLALILVAAMVLGAMSCSRKEKKPDTGDKTQNATEDVTEVIGTSKVRLTAVGDIIAHETILNLADTGNGYDFTSLFALLKNDISSMDLAIANVETPLGGGPYTGYPNFNTPDEMGLAVIDAGFDVALQASNHSMDAGTDGILHSIRFWKQHADEILMVGMHESQEEADDIPIITVNGISFAVLNYTYGLNGYELPYDEDYLITLMNDSTWDYIKEQVQRADAMVISPPSQDSAAAAG